MGRRIMVATGNTIQILDPCPEDVPEEKGISKAFPSLVLLG
jgi:hypothetical protein